MGGRRCRLDWGEPPLSTVLCAKPVAFSPVEQGDQNVGDSFSATNYNGRTVFWCDVHKIASRGTP